MTRVGDNFHMAKISTYTVSPHCHGDVNKTCRWASASPFRFGSFQWGRWGEASPQNIQLPPQKKEEKRRKRERESEKAREREKEACVLQ